MKQLALPVQLRDEATFANFYNGPNIELVNFLQTNINHSNQVKLIYVWGAQATGRSHLLQACCHLAEQQRSSSIYFSLKDYRSLSPEIFENVENMALITIDDIDSIAGEPYWEEALFNLYNRCQFTSTQWIVAASASPLNLKFHLKDLQSRLMAGVTFQLMPLTDEDKIAALKLCAKNRGLMLPQQTAKFLLNHYERNMKTLFQILEQFDQFSLEEKCKLTVPFLKKMLS